MSQPRVPGLSLPSQSSPVSPKAAPGSMLLGLRSLADLSFLVSMHPSRLPGRRLKDSVTEMPPGARRPAWLWQCLIKERFSCQALLPLHEERKLLGLTGDARVRGSSRGKGKRWLLPSHSSFTSRQPSLVAVGAARDLGPLTAAATLCLSAGF